MTISKLFLQWLVSALFLAMLCATTNAQEKHQFEYLTYSVPRGFVLQNESNANARAYMKRFGNGEFALLTLYTSTGSFGDPQVDFSRSWKQLVGDMAISRNEPSTTRTPLGDAISIAGHEKITFSNQLAAAVLVTVTVKRRLFTFLAIFNGEKSGQEAQAFLEDISVDDERIPASHASPPTAPTSALPPLSGRAPPRSQDSGSSGNPHLVRRWQYHYATPTSSTLLREYVFKADGRFENPRNRINVKKPAVDGSYRLSGDRLRLVYDDGVTEEYTVAFEETTIMGERKRKALMTDNKGETRHFFLVKN
ncbi:MAG: hypothetical protein ACRDAM_19500 [Casimicrobium sp.]